MISGVITTSTSFFRTTLGVTTVFPASVIDGEVAGAGCLGSVVFDRPQTAADDSGRDFDCWGRAKTPDPNPAHRLTSGVAQLASL